MRIFYCTNVRKCAKEISFQTPKTVYVAHPLRGDVEGNMRRATDICRALSHREDLVIMSPLHAFSFCSPTGEQYTPFRLCQEWLGRCDMLWLFGDWRRSEGCKMEWMAARERSIPTFQADIHGGGVWLCRTFLECGHV